MARWRARISLAARREMFLQRCHPQVQGLPAEQREPRPPATSLSPSVYRVDQRVDTATPSEPNTGPRSELDWYKLVRNSSAGRSRGLPTALVGAMASPDSLASPSSPSSYSMSSGLSETDTGPGQGPALRIIHALQTCLIRKYSPLNRDSHPPPR